MSEIIQLNTEDFATLVRRLGSRAYLLERPSLNQREVVAPVPPDPPASPSNLLDRNPPPILRFDLEQWAESGGPARWDHQTLIDALLTLGDVPDALGFTNLTEEEAATIRSGGFWAEPGPWEIPALPYELVRGNSMLECFSDWWLEGNPRTPLPSLTSIGTEPASIEIVLQSETSAAASPFCRPTFPPDETRILKLLGSNHGVMLKRRLQQRLWRIEAPRLRQALDSLVSAGQIEIDRRWVRRLPVTS